MPAASEIAAFLLFAFSAAATPGPSNVLVMNAGARAGLLRGLWCVAGVVAGMGALMGLAALGLGELLRAWPAVLLVLKVAGSAFLLHLAWQIATAPARPPEPGSGPDGAVGFWKAFSFQWVNPKSWVVAASVAASFSGGDSPHLRALLIALGFASAAAPACGIWLAFGALLQRWLATPERARAFSRTTGGLLAASILLLWS